MICRAWTRHGGKHESENGFRRGDPSSLGPGYVRRRPEDHRRQVARADTAGPGDDRVTQRLVRRRRFHARQTRVPVGRLFLLPSQQRWPGRDLRHLPSRADGPWKSLHHDAQGGLSPAVHGLPQGHRLGSRGLRRVPPSKGSSRPCQLVGLGETIRRQGPQVLSAVRGVFPKDRQGIFPA